MIGISGAGKSTWVKKVTSEFPDSQSYCIICPDTERKRLTGDVSNQDSNEQVFQNCYDKLKESVNNENIRYIFWDATNLSTKYISNIVDIIRESSSQWDIQVDCFEDSRNWKECRRRVKKDIKNGVDRSKTYDVFVDEENTVPLIKSMSDRYINLVDNVLNTWCQEHNIIQLLIGGGELVKREI